MSNIIEYKSQMGSDEVDFFFQIGPQYKFFLKIFPAEFVTSTDLNLEQICISGLFF